MSVVMIDNIHAGETEKTPIAAALVSSLQEKGAKASIISRSYGRKSKVARILDVESRVEGTGDEPLLLLRKIGVPTTAGSSCTEVDRTLLAAYPDIGLVVTDDGLQHYVSRRDAEIAVFPSADTG